MSGAVRFAWSRLRLGAILLLVACSACREQSTYAGWTTTRPKFDAVRQTVSGPVVGWNYNLPHEQSTFAELGYQADPDHLLQFSSIRSGLLGPPLHAGPFEFGGRMDLAYTWVDYEPFTNLNRLFSLGLSIQPTLHLGDDWALTSLVGYRFYFDQSKRQLCADGTKPTESGAAACLDHGGLGPAYHRLGDGHGPEFMFGLRYSH